MNRWPSRKRGDWCDPSLNSATFLVGACERHSEGPPPATNHYFSHFLFLSFPIFSFIFFHAIGSNGGPLKTHEEGKGKSLCGVHFIEYFFFTVLKKNHTHTTHRARGNLYVIKRDVEEVKRPRVKGLTPFMLH